MGEVVSLLARDDVGAVEADRGEFARRMLPTVLKTTATMLRDRATNKDGSVADDPLVRRMVCVLLDVVRQMSEEQYSLLVRALQHEAGGAGGAGSSLVDDCLALMLQLLQRPVFRPHWADMLHLQHYVMLHALRLLSSTLRERLHSEECNTESLQSSLREWFMVCAQLATAPALQLHDLGAARRRRVAALYGDLRRDVATAIADMWYALGEHKHSFIPSLVGPFLEVSFLPDDEVRNTTIPLFYDMMITEYSHSVASGENSDNPLRALESELIDKVDVLASRGLGDGAWRARFVSACGARCREGGAGGAGAALNSLLAQMHSSAQQWAEAGLALRLHAKLLEWSDAPLPPRLRHPTQDCAHHATHRDLKEALYLEIAQLLNRGRQWELAVEVVKELVCVYEEEALGYAPLAELHAQLAALYEAMLRTPRSHPGYFRVMYHGAGFPEHLRVPHDRMRTCLVRTNSLQDGWSVTELEISDKLPGILRWFPVVSVRTYWVSPLEAAVEALRETNRALKALVLEARTSDAPLHQLSMRLNGILDPAVQGGIVNYERAFLTPAYETRRPEHLPLLNQLRDLIADQVPLLKMGLEVHKARISPALQGLHEHMELCFQRVQTHVHQRYGRKNCELETELVERRRALRDSIQTEPGIINNRISDISTGNDTAKSKFFSAINPLTRNSSGGVVSYFGTLQNSPRRRDKRRAKKEASSETPERGGSQWYAPSAALNGNASPQATPLAPQVTPTTPSLDSTSSPLRELRQELVTERPLRAEAERERRLSQRAIIQLYKLVVFQLVTERPLRAEAERERRLSQRASLLASSSSAPHSNRDSLGTTDSNQEEEEPPPLPQKQSQSQRHSEIDSDQNNNPEVLPRNNYDTVWTPRGSFLYNSIAARRNDRPPTPPPKKKNAQNNA
ncbi:Dedicator of cytokinesis protein 1 [Papilio machaon]|uniref:Dedicator of cytokinesis protein 1 n=1 Tax=Papilio machaon TaxID=76193 RepID=A0A0N1INU6_PAPMA|nr:Dedicator of cytokinesis protein 1 [Papilio machaon]